MGTKQRGKRYNMDSKTLHNKAQTFFKRNLKLILEIDELKRELALVVKERDTLLKEKEREEHFSHLKRGDYARE